LTIWFLFFYACVILHKCAAAAYRRRVERSSIFVWRSEQLSAVQSSELGWVRRSLQCVAPDIDRSPRYVLFCSVVLHSLQHWCPIPYDITSRVELVFPRASLQSSTRSAQLMQLWRTTGS